MGMTADDAFALALAASQVFTRDTFNGGGAAKGSPCQIKSKVPIEGGVRITFSWELADGTERTETVDLMNGPRGETGAKGDKGDKGATGAKGDTGERGAQGVPGTTPNISVIATVANNTGNPNVQVIKGGTDEAPVFHLAFSGLKGQPGSGEGGTGVTPVITVEATVDDTVGTPSVNVTKTGTDEAPVFNLEFSGLKGEAGSGGTGVDNSSNYIYIAHRGYYGTDGIIENTAEAFIKAAEIGYKWAEVDVRKTKDNVIVAAHDVRLNLYKNGTSSNISIAEKTFAELLEYSYDAAGTKHVETLAYILYSLKNYDLTLLLDIKVSDITEQCFATAYSYGYSKNVVVGCGQTWASEHISVLNKYKDIPIRVYPGNYDTCKQIFDSIQNPVYLDGAAAGTSAANYANILFTRALALNKPILVAMFDSTSVDYRKYLLNSITGLMCDTPKTISQIKSYTRQNVTMSDVVVEPSKVLVSTDPQTVTAQNSTSGGGYINFYTDKPEIATVDVDTIGENATATVNSVSTGKCNLFIQNATVRKSIEVSSAPNGFYAVCEASPTNVTSGVTNKACLFFLTADPNKKLSISSAFSDIFYRYNLYYFGGDVRLPIIPDGATTLSASFDEGFDGRVFVKFYNSSKAQISSHGWAANYELAIPEGATSIYLAIKYTDGRNIVPYNNAEQKQALTELINAFHLNYT